MAIIHTQPPTALNISMIYDAVMAEIEPDLTMKMLPVLDDLYKNETKKQRRKRYERYSRALEIFNDRWQTAVKSWKDTLHSARDVIVTQSKEKSKKEDDSALEQIESQFDQ